MRNYEMYLVIDADAEEEEAAAIVERATQLITAGHGDTSGEVTQQEARGKRRLAYPIKKKLNGLDFLLTFETPPEALPELERFLKLDEQVLRYLLVRTDLK
jgi:small subunit ribosomal protein S6